MLFHGHSQGVDWELADCLQTLVGQLDTMFPGRAKQTDGSIASAEHLKRSPRSQHNPHRFGERQLVAAADITHNADVGVDCQWLWDTLLAGKDDRILYVIFNHKIFNNPVFNTEGAKRRGGWNPGPYTGGDPHTGHLHISVRGYKDSTKPWALPQTLKPVRKSPSGKSADWVEGFAQEMRGIKATPKSLAYALRFYRRVAEQAPNLDGSQPEEVADWLMSQQGG